MSTVSPLVSIRNATIWRGQTRVFSELNLEIQQHEQVAILGPNGCGKTTLLKAINREIYPVQKADASFEILGRDRWNVRELRKHIGLVSQDLQQRYKPTATALEVIVSGFSSSIGVHGLLARNVSDDQVHRAMAILGRLGLASLVSRPLAEMSTGQQRRCLLGRAMVHDPATLILDEPTSGLDLASSFDYLAAIRRFTLQGRNILLATHHLGEIPPEVGRVILIADGRIVADGPKSDVLDAMLLSSVYGVPIRVREVDGYYFAYPGS